MLKDKTLMFIKLGAATGALLSLVTFYNIFLNRPESVAFDIRMVIDPALLIVFAAGVWFFKSRVASLALFAFFLVGKAAFLIPMLMSVNAQIWADFKGHIILTILGILLLATPLALAVFATFEYQKTKVKSDV